MKNTLLSLLSILFSGFLFAQEKPNILIFYADDLGYMDTGFMGSDFYETPNLDRLRKQGMLFTDAYAASANCAPSRASLMTGVYSPRHQIYTVNQGGFMGDLTKKRFIPVFNRVILNPNLQTIPSILKAQGYATIHLGKWHLSPRPLVTTYGFDENIGGNHLGSPNGGYFSPYNNAALPDGKEGEHLPARLAQEATAWIDKQESPFFMYFSFYSVHKPIEARKDLLNKYQQKKPGKLHQHAAYAAMVEAMDEAIGVVLNHLEENDLLEDTLIFFSSDNGPYGSISSANPLRGAKGTFYEGGIRVPTLMSWEGKIPANTTSTTPIHQVDFLPTIVDAVGTKLTQQTDGVSLLSLAQQEKQLSSRALYWHFPSYLKPYKEDKEVKFGHSPHWRAVPCSVIREGDWKLIQDFEKGSFELYNLSTDLSETKNVLETEPEKAQELQEKLTQWQQEVKAFIPKENRHYAP